MVMLSLSPFQMFVWIALLVLLVILMAETSAKMLIRYWFKQKELHIGRIANASGKVFEKMGMDIANLIENKAKEVDEDEQVDSAV